jgi:Deuterolysin metalloprotease (M35) family
MLTSPPVRPVPAKLPNAGTGEIYGYNAINAMNTQDKLNNADSYALLGAGKCFLISIILHRLLVSPSFFLRSKQQKSVANSPYNRVVH